MSEALRSDDPKPSLQVTAPRQARSRATMERFVRAAEDLLATKPFEQITMAELSRAAGSAPTAFYARFSDKNALLLEIHERFRERAAASVLATFASPERADWTVEEFVRVSVQELVQLYRTHRNLLRSVLLADNPLMYERAADLTRTISAALAARVPAPPEHVDFGVRAALAVLQQDLLYSPGEPARFSLDHDALVEAITGLVLDALRA